MTESLTSLRGFANPFPRSKLKSILFQKLNCRVPDSTLVMVAKLLEELLVDIFRKMEHQGNRRRSNILYETHLKRVVTQHPYLSFLLPFLADIENIPATPEPEEGFSAEEQESQLKKSKPTTKSKPTQSTSRKKRQSSTSDASEKKFKPNQSGNPLAITDNIIDLFKEVDILKEYETGDIANFPNPHESTDLREILKPRILQREIIPMNGPDVAFSNPEFDPIAHLESLSNPSSIDYHTAETIIWTRPECEKQWLQGFLQDEEEEEEENK